MSWQGLVEDMVDAAWPATDVARHGKDKDRAAYFTVPYTEKRDL